jgi:hypothetical protein
MNSASGVTMSIINQYSYVIFSAFVGVLLAAGLWLWKAPAPGLRVALLAAYLLGAVGLHFALRYRSGQGEISAASAEAVLANGRPTFVMLYSNY